MDFEAAVESLDIKLLFPYVVEAEVGGDNDLLGSDRTHLAKLVFSHERLLLANLLQHAEHEGLFLFEVINEDNLLVKVAVPVLGLVLLIAVRESLEYPEGLACARSTVNPLIVHRDAVRLVGAGLVEVDSRLDSGVVLDSNAAVFEGFLSAEGNELLVLAGSVALDIKLSRLDPKGPWSVNSSFLLVAVSVGAVVVLYSSKVGLLAVLFEVPHALLLLELNEELDVKGRALL